MTKLMILALSLTSFSAFANCSLYLEKQGVTTKQDKVLTRGLLEKGIKIAGPKILFLLLNLILVRLRIPRSSGLAILLI